MFKRFDLRKRLLSRFFGVPRKASFEQLKEIHNKMLSALCDPSRGVFTEAEMDDTLPEQLQRWYNERKKTFIERRAKERFDQVLS